MDPDPPSTAGLTRELASRNYNKYDDIFLPYPFIAGRSVPQIIKKKKNHVAAQMAKPQESEMQKYNKLVPNPDNSELGVPIYKPPNPLTELKEKYHFAGTKNEATHETLEPNGKQVDKTHVSQSLVSQTQPILNYANEHPMRMTQSVLANTGVSSFELSRTNVFGKANLPILYPTEPKKRESSTKVVQNSAPVEALRLQKPQQIASEERPHLEKRQSIERNSTIVPIKEEPVKPAPRELDIAPIQVSLAKHNSHGGASSYEPEKAAKSAKLSLVQKFETKFQSKKFIRTGGFNKIKD